MNPIYLTQTTLEIDLNSTGVLAMKNINIPVYLLNKGKCFVSIEEFNLYGRNCEIHISANFSTLKIN